MVRVGRAAAPATWTLCSNPDLIGICSFLVEGTAITFFVHRDEIARFLS